MHRVRVLAGSTLALILAAAVSAAGAAPDTSAIAAPPSGPAVMPAPAERDYSVPGSMPKPSALMPSDDGLRFRGTLPASDGSAAAPQHERPVQPAPEAAVAPAEPPRSPDNRPPAPRPAIATVPATPQAAPRPAIVNAPPAPPAASKPTAPTTAAAPEPARAVVAVDIAAVADRLRELIAGKKFEQLVARKAERDAIAALYGKSLDFRPLWIAAGGPSERAKDIIEHLRGVDADGLDPRDYPVPNFAVAGAQAQAEAELKFTETVLSYARHAQNGRVHFSRVSPNIEYKLSYDPDDVLKKIAASNDLRKTLEQFNPQQPAYRALKAKLAELQAAPVKSGAPRFANGPVLRYSRDRRGHETVMADARVPKLRERLGVVAEPNMNYDQSLAAAVAKFQKAQGLQSTGQLNSATLEALNGPSRSKQIDAVVATMERWRWMPRDLGRTHVVLNIPDFNLRIYHDGAKVWQTRVVVGKPTQQTPLLTETMKFITVNPTWNVPQSIIYNELLPIYETSDPQIFERQGLKVERDRDGSIRVFQPPGERNALGQIRFNFPNKFLVYQHDTPERHYFAQDKRAYSHGCMRVQDPLKYAELLLSYASPRAGLTQARVRQMFGGAEQQIDFHNQIPVHIAYQTAFVDERGKLEFRDDVYGHDAKVLSLMRGGERAVADSAIERPADPNFKPTPEATQRLNSVARGGVANPFALFEQLFR
jgi:murein L,D-transpeptidase YcbB/YkuD